MDNVFTLSTLYYSLFGTFLFYQQRHSANFKGASNLFHIFLSIFSILGSISGLVYIIALWYNTHWYTALAVFATAIIFSVTVGYILALVIGRFTTSMLGFIALPIFGILMFLYMQT
jgi:hypothetical protein